MFAKSNNSTLRPCTWSEMPDRRRYKIDMLSIPGDLWSGRTHIAEAYSKGIAYRLYKDLLTIYSPEALILY